jgi:hypothetical protein
MLLIRLCRGAGQISLDHIVWSGYATCAASRSWRLRQSRDAAALDNHLSELRGTEIMRAHACRLYYDCRAAALE